jgi:hypothetical protein
MVFFVRSNASAGEGRSDRIMLKEQAGDDAVKDSACRLRKAALHI